MIGLSKGSMERKLKKMSLFRECLQDWDLQEGRTTVQQTEALTFIMTAQRLPKSRIFTELMVPSVKYQSNKQKVIASISSPSIIWSSTPFSNSDPTVLESKITRHHSRFIDKDKLIHCEKSPAQQPLPCLSLGVSFLRVTVFLLLLRPSRCSSRRTISWQMGRVEKCCKTV